jgi:hypothetical protein
VPYLLVGLTVGALVIAQDPNQGALLPDALFPAVSAASEAEWSHPKRFGEARAILLRERSRVASDPELLRVIDLRVAANILRSRSEATSSLASNDRWKDALFTFARLDLKEPGLDRWLQKARENEKPRREKSMLFQLAYFAPSQSFDLSAAHDRLSALFSRLDIPIQRVDEANASFLLRIRALGVQHIGAMSQVRMGVVVQHRDHGRVIWEDSLTHTASGSNSKAAQDACIDALLRLAGRDLLFHWLSTTWFRNSATSPQVGSTN